MLLGGGAFAILLLAVTVVKPGQPVTDYRPAGSPRPLPTRQLAPVTAEEFGGLLVGLDRPAVVNVWASWCAPCRAEMPLLQRAAERYEGRVAFLGVASSDARGAALAFLDDLGVEYPNVFDAAGEVRDAVDLRGFPTTLIFDDEGMLLDTVVGGVTETRLAAQLEDLLR